MEKEKYPKIRKYISGDMEIVEEKTTTLKEKRKELLKHTEEAFDDITAKDIFEQIEKQDKKAVDDLMKKAFCKACEELINKCNCGMKKDVVSLYWIKKILGEFGK